MSEWKVIGHVAVDSGCIVISDPCQARNAANAWDAHINGDGRDFPVITGNSTWGPDAQDAVFTTTGAGDGCYDVEARYIGDDVAEVRIVFIDLDGLEL